jgi:imidazolonepropionase
MSMIRLKNLAAVFSGEGFTKKSGRYPQTEDCGFIRGPVDMVLDQAKGTIVSVGTPAAGHEREIDASGLVATPGFIDSHTHALFSGTRAREYFMRWAGQSYRDIAEKGGGILNTFVSLRDTSDDRLLEELYARLAQMRAKGTLCVEIKSGYGGDPEAELRSLRLIKRAKSDPYCPVRVTSTYLALHALPKGVAEEDYVSKMIEALPVVVSEGLADAVDAFPEQGFFSLEQSLRFAREALKLGLRSKVHADELTPMACVENFVPLQALSVDHLQKISPEGIESLAASNTVATFLPTTSFYLDLEYAPARRVVDAGARVALASDYNPGTSPESGLQLTALLAASRMKLSAAEIFAALTFNAAAALDLQGKTGQLLVGQAADLLLWKLITPPAKTQNGQELLEEIFVESPKPALSFQAGK